MPEVGKLGGSKVKSQHMPLITCAGKQLQLRLPSLVCIGIRWVFMGSLSSRRTLHEHSMASTLRFGDSHKILEYRNNLVGSYFISSLFPAVVFVQTVPS